MNIQTVRNSFSSVARITNADNEEKGFSISKSRPYYSFMDNKQAKMKESRWKHFMRTPMGIIFTVVVSFAALFFIPAVLLELPGRIFVWRPDHPKNYEYVRLFYNVKCMNTDDHYTEYDILDDLYYLGIPKDKAKELFTEAKKNLEGPIEDGSPLKRCYQETLDYYDKALSVLKYHNNRSSRIRDGFPEGLE
jgi:hypothetical protein